MFSIITFSSSNLYFTPVILTEFFEEEEVWGTDTKLIRDYNLLNILYI